jgi:nucleoside phosphorylase
MEERVLQALVDHIRAKGSLSGAHDFRMWVRENLGEEGRRALTSLELSEKVRLLHQGYYPTINALRSAPSECFRPEIETARRLLPLLKAHFKEHQGKPLTLTSLTMQVESGAMVLPFIVLLCDGLPVSAGSIDETGGATTVTMMEDVLDLDPAVWPLKGTAVPDMAAQVPVDHVALRKMVDDWAKGVDIDRWRTWTQQLVGVNPTIFGSDCQRLYELYDWLKSRVFLDERHPVVAALRNFGEVLGDLLVNIETDAEHLEKLDAYAITKAWKRQWLNPKEYQEREAKWQRSIDEFGNLTLELTRAVNLVLQVIRINIDANYRLDLGRLPVAGALTEDITQPWLYTEYRDEQRYPGRTTFFQGEYLLRDRFYVLAGHEKRAKSLQKGVKVKKKNLGPVPPNGPAGAPSQSTAAAAVMPASNSVIGSPEGNLSRPRDGSDQGNLRVDAPSKADVLIVVVTDGERDAVFAAAKQTTGVDQPIRSVHGKSRTYQDLGVIGGARVFVVQSEMGSSPVGGSATTVASAITELRPSTVLGVGIAFGVDPQKQPIGQILVSKQLQMYDIHRVGTNADGSLEIRSRGDKVSISSKMLSVLHDAQMSFKRKVQVKFELILSGEKLVDNIDFRGELMKRESEAKGGEMEGAGLYVAAFEAKVEWCVIKAVCDYADGEKKKDKANRQKTAARNAATFTLHALNCGGFAPT